MNFELLVITWKLGVIEYPQITPAPSLPIPPSPSPLLSPCPNSPCPININQQLLLLVFVKLILALN